MSPVKLPEISVTPHWNTHHFHDMTFHLCILIGHCPFLQLKYVFVISYVQIPFYFVIPVFLFVLLPMMILSISNSECFNVIHQQIKVQMPTFDRSVNLEVKMHFSTLWDVKSALSHGLLEHDTIVLLISATAPISYQVLSMSLALKHDMHQIAQGVMEKCKIVVIPVMIRAIMSFGGHFLSSRFLHWYFQDHLVLVV